MRGQKSTVILFLCLFTFGIAVALINGVTIAGPPAQDRGPTRIELAQDVKLINAGVDGGEIWLLTRPMRSEDKADYYELIRCDNKRPITIHETRSP